MRKVQVKDTIEIINGFAFDSNLFNDRDIGLPIARIRDVTRGYSETYYSGEYSSGSIIDNGAILIGMDGEFNIAVWKGGKALLNQRVCRVIPKLGVVDETFIRYRLSILLKEIEDNTPFVTVKHLSSEKLKKERIIIPPLPEQQHIAAILDKADQLRRLRFFAIELGDSYLQSVFLEMFGDPATNPMGWEAEQVNNICNLVRGSSPRPKSDPRYYGGPIPRLMVEDLTRDGLFVTPRIDSLTEEGAKMSRPMKVGSVVMVVSGNTGLPAIVKIDACIHDGFVGFRRLSPRFNSIFFVYQLLALKLSSEAQAAGAIWQNLTTDQIKRWNIICPPLHIQNKFNQIVIRYERLRVQHQEALRQLEHLFQSLLDRAFEGNL